MKIEYKSSVKVPAGWRSINIVAIAEKVSNGFVVVQSIDSIDGEYPNYGQSRTGANRQKFNGKYWANCEIGKRKRLSACKVLAE